MVYYIAFFVYLRKSRAVKRLYNPPDAPEASVPPPVVPQDSLHRIPTVVFRLFCFAFLVQYGPTACSNLYWIFATDTPAYMRDVLSLKYAVMNGIAWLLCPLLCLLAAGPLPFTTDSACNTDRARMVSRVEWSVSLWLACLVLACVFSVTEAAPPTTASGAFQSLWKGTIPALPAVCGALWYTSSLRMRLKDNGHISSNAS